MKKVTTFDFTGVTEAQVAAVDGVLAEAKKHTYSVSRVYGAYNDVMGTKDEPQSCPSCLRTRVKELQDWKRAYDGRTAEGAGDPKAAKGKTEKPAAPAANTNVQYSDAEGEGYVAPGEGVTRLLQAEGADGLPFDFTAGEDLAAPNKGSVKYADGSTVKPGTYVTADGSTLGVQPGGKATITAADDSLL